MFGFVTVGSVNPFPGDGREVRRGEPLLSHKTVTGWATQREVLGYDIVTESVTSASPARKVDDLCSRVAEWPGTGNGNGEGSTSTSREVASRILRNPAQTVLRPSASAAI